MEQISQLKNITILLKAFELEIEDYTQTADDSSKHIYEDMISEINEAIKNSTDLNTLEDTLIKATANVNDVDYCKVINALEEGRLK